MSPETSNNPEMNNPEAGNNSEAQEKKKRKSGRLYPFMVLVILLVILFFITIILLALHYSGFGPSGDNVFNITQAEPGLRPFDDEGVWQNYTQISVFSSEYENGEHKITVSSSSGDKVFAPGTAYEYHFYLQNTGGAKISFILSMNAVITVRNYDGVIGELPVTVRLLRYDGTYLVGSKDEWLPVNELRGDVEEATLHPYSYANYSFIWQWEFESGDDAWDTFLGAASVDSKIELSLSIGVRALQDDGSGSGSGSGNLIGMTRHCLCGSVCLCWLWIIIIVILLVTEAVTLIFLHKYKKLCKKYEEELNEENEEEEPDAEESAPEAGEPDEGTAPEADNT